MRDHLTSRSSPTQMQASARRRARGGPGRWAALVLAAGLLASQASARTAPEVWTDATLDAGRPTFALADRKSAGFYDPVVVLSQGHVRVLTGQDPFARPRLDSDLFDTDYDCDRLPEVELNRAVFAANYLANYLKASKPDTPRAKMWLRPEDDPKDWLKEKAACGF